MSAPTVGSPSRSDLDIATGILLGLRGGTAGTAHDELLGVASAYHLSLFRLSRALIGLAAGDPVAPTPAGDVARLHWEGLIRER